MDDWRRDPVEEAAHIAVMIDEYGDAGGLMVCDECGAVLREGDAYYETDLGNLCEECADVWLNEKRRLV